MKQLKRVPEFVRFILVGVFATALHYGIYLLLQRLINVNIAYTLGYALSFIANFYLTAYFTFGKKPSWGKAFGFIQLPATHRATEYISLVGTAETLRPCSRIRHRHSGQLFIGTFCFQTARLMFSRQYCSKLL